VYWGLPLHPCLLWGAEHGVTRINMMYKTECISSSTQGLAVEAQGGTAGLTSAVRSQTIDYMNKKLSHPVLRTKPDIHYM
jgi:hypothetical protein